MRSACIVTARPRMVTKGRRALVALAATTAIQIYVSLAATATAVLAPEIAQAFDVAPKWIGVFVGLVYVGAMLASLACGGFIERFGAIRISQFGVLLSAAGTLMIALAPSYALALLIAAALLIGVGYGPITPASSHVLIRTAEPHRLALTFSIKQTGVPAGAALAGAVLPALALVVGWRIALLVAALAGLVVAAVAEKTHAMLDTELQTARHSARTFSLATVLQPLRIVVGSRTLAELAVVSFIYAGTQVCLTSFIVVYLTESLRWSLVGAGFVLTAATVGGVVGRIGWGLVADRVAPPRRVLGVIGVIAAICGVVITLATPAWSTAAVAMVALIFGATAIGWNGVQLAEVARHAPQGAAGAVTGAAGFITFSGVVAGPPIFALLAASTGSYRVGFGVFAAMSGISGIVLLMPWRPTTKRPKPR
ncbi:MAG: MFS transporter [Betaproteobacteria bacterium]|nr:MAG: MFS transporter [Betaproteobacteria bacterium]